MSLRTTSKRDQPHVEVDLAHHEGSECSSGGNIVGIRCGGISQGRFMLPKAEVEELLRVTGLSHQELLMTLIHPASKNARTPISSFKVGAVGLGGSGNIYVGVNLELHGLPLYNSVHAEQFLIVNAISNGETSLQMMAISAAPCGHCRQFFCELACADEIQFFFGRQLTPLTLDDLLPYRFSPSDLLGSDQAEENGAKRQRTEESGAEKRKEEKASGSGRATLLMGERNNRLVFKESSAKDVKALQTEEPEPVARAVEAALASANRSYAPYSNCPSGVAVVTANCDVYSGSYIESAAYNPSLPPLQACLVSAVAQGMPHYSELSYVVLVEKTDGGVQQEGTLRHVLEMIAPQATLVVLHAE